jgi:isopenicillin N synthase-like dioxygenase
MTIPVVDLTLLEGERDRLLDELVAAYRDVGFAYLVGHGIPDELVGRVFAASAAFHALPLEQKMSIELDERHRGFIPIAVSTDRTSSVAEVTTPNQSESFMMMREDPPDGPEVAAGTYLAGPNQWPDLPGFRDAVEAYHEAMSALGHRVVGLFAAALGDADGVLREAFATPTTWLRLLHYPPVSGGDDVYGSAPHRDFGCITILAQDDVGGLAVRHPSGSWIDVAPRPGAFVMNVGDMLHRWSNGVLRSTPHRVVNRSGRERYSVPFFFDPHMSAVVAPLPGCVGDDHPPSFAPIEFGSFVRDQLEATYEHHGAPRGA